ncbi:MAG: hypothetical protein ACTHLY_15795 [Pseudolabrys sp.]
MTGRRSSSKSAGAVALDLRYCDQLFDQSSRYRNLPRAIIMKQRGDLDEHRPIMEAVIGCDAVMRSI